jgi:hypothetical protein
MKAFDRRVRATLKNRDIFAEVVHAQLSFSTKDFHISGIPLLVNDV